ncbi:MAG: hypothetical protein ACK5N0_02290 [Synechococcaceae cyanobacterium]
MTAPFAYEQPTLQSAWDGVRRHLLTVVVIYGISAVLNLLGYGLANLFVGGGLESAPGSGQLPLADWNDGLRVLLHQLLQLPFMLAASLVSVLLTAVPALYYETGKPISPGKSLQLLLQRPLRYLLAGILATLVIAVGLLLCLLPGLAAMLVLPVYINRIFVTDQPIVEAFMNSFQAVYGHAKGWRFLLIELIAGLLVFVLVVGSLFGLALFVAVAVSIVQSQNLALLVGFSLLGLGVIGACLALWLILPQMAVFYVQNSAYRLGILR